MKWTVRLLAVVVMSALIAVSLSELPQSDASLPGTNRGGTGISAGQLSERNLADFIVEMPLQQRIRKVELNHSILSIDLNLPQNADKGVIYRDLYTIAALSVKKTANVNKVLVRVMDYSGASGASSAQLVMAMEADREHAGELDAHPKDMSAPALEQLLKARFHVTYTSRWQQRFP